MATAPGIRLSVSALGALLLGCVVESPAPVTTEADYLKDFEPGEGVYCAWAIYTTVAEVGERCFAGQNPKLQSELRRSVRRIEAFVVDNAKPAPTPEEIAEFKRDQGNVGASTESLCIGDTVEFYKAIAERGAEAIRSDIDRLLARQGPPTWGTCF